MFMLLLTALSIAVTPPGSYNPNVTQSNIHQTICVSGWTGTIRPKTSYTNALKIKQMKAQGLKGSPSSYEEDHFVSLELGGHPTDPNNLVPEHRSRPNGASVKDMDENRLHRLVCSGKETLDAARKEIVKNWTNK